MNLLRTPFLLLILLQAPNTAISQQKVDLVIVGGGASGTAAAIQAARMDVTVLVIEETPWLGGMLTAAGVSAIDGNHNLPSGIWGEFRERLYKHYGGSNAVSTGWVSNTLFEPSIGNKILKEWVKEYPNIKVLYNSTLEKIEWLNGKWRLEIFENNKFKYVNSTIVIDATELGDVAASLGYAYFTGMDPSSRFNESEAPPQSNNIVQDLTYVAILKDFGKGMDKAIPKPKDYNATKFSCACAHSDPITNDTPILNCEKMLTYGKLPGNKYMINWPRCGNDFYTNILEASKSERLKELSKAKSTTLEFVYYLQNELGFKNLGLAEDEFPTPDRLPFLPYHRESRRFVAEAMLTLPFVRDPYGQNLPLYRTGIAVGDYPIDHHHNKNPAAPNIDFLKIRVPSYNVPLGSLIPKGSTNLIVAEKNIGVSNIVNGTTRLQPVVLGIGQAAGALAATSLHTGKNLESIDVRTVQTALLNHGGFIMPFMDVPPTHPHFKSIQKIGATGILKGFGVPFKWANQTWFYPESKVSEFELIEGLRPYFPALRNYWNASGNILTINSFIEVLNILGRTTSVETMEQALHGYNLELEISQNQTLNRLQTAVLLDVFLNPFSIPINFSGDLK